MPLTADNGAVCSTCDGRTAKKALICPHCGMLLRPNYAVILAMTGVWFFGFTFGILYFVTMMMTSM